MDEGFRAGELLPLEILDLTWEQFLGAIRASRIYDGPDEVTADL